MTPAEFSKMREQVTELYQKAWGEWFRASHDEHEINWESGDDFCDRDEFDRAVYARKTWNNILSGLDEVHTNLLRMQCYAKLCEQEAAK